MTLKATITIAEGALGVSMNMEVSKEGGTAKEMQVATVIDVFIEAGFTFINTVALVSVYAKGETDVDALQKAVMKVVEKLVH